MSYQVDRIRKDFPSLNTGLAYFDGPGGSQVPKVVGDASRGLGEAMVGINVADLPAPHRLSERGW